jgi:hypothetical protein
MHLSKIRGPNSAAGAAALEKEKAAKAATAVAAAATGAKVDAARLGEFLIRTGTD